MSYELYVYPRDTMAAVAPVSTHRTWKDAVKIGDAQPADMVVVIQHNAEPNAPTTWMRGYHRIARDGYGWVG